MGSYRKKVQNRVRRLNVRAISGVEIYLFEMTIKLDPAAMLPLRFAENNHNYDDYGEEEDDDDENYEDDGDDNDNASSNDSENYDQEQCVA